jgi:hypothetical protein
LGRRFCDGSSGVINPLLKEATAASQQPFFAAFAPVDSKSVPFFNTLPCHPNLEDRASDCSP